MTRAGQKEDEKYIAQNFAVFMGYNWDIICSPNEENYPDLIINYDNTTFGLEVRELPSDEIIKEGSTLMKKESHRRKLKNQLSSKYYDNCNRPIYVTIIGKFDKIDLNPILNILMSNRFDDYESRKFDYNAKYGPIIISVVGLPINFEKYSEWQISEFGIVGNYEKNKLEEIIAIKSKNISKYLVNVNSISLLLYCNHSYNSGKIHFPEYKEINKYGFKDLYLYEYLLNGYKY